MDFPKEASSMTSIPKVQTEIPKNFPVKKIPAKPLKNKDFSAKPKATSRLIPWDIAQSMAPYAGLSYEQQIEKTEVIIKSNLTNWYAKEKEESFD